MTKKQPTSRAPPAVPLAMSAAQDPTPSETTTSIPGATSTPIPIHNAPANSKANSNPSTSNSSPDQPTSSAPKPPLIPKPRLMFEIRDLSHSGSAALLSAVNPLTLLTDAITSVISQLYLSHHQGSPAPVRSITLVLRAMDGVAYTTGKEFDPEHKEIHFSLGYISRISPKERMRDEIYGVVVHEMVHVWQWTADGVPGGLVEGVADWVRLGAGFVPPHWKREGEGAWDRGYQHTGYFLDWIERRWGAGKVTELNARLRERRLAGKKYEEKEFWVGLLGMEVGVAWKEYGKTLESGKE